MIDTGPAGSASPIAEASGRYFSGRLLRAIALTHDHVDHAGAFLMFLDAWDVPVDSTRPVSQGGQGPSTARSVAQKGRAGPAVLPLVFPQRIPEYHSKEAVALRDRVRALHADGTMLHGHSGGHISFLRDRDRLFTADDAFVTMYQESIYSVATQAQEVNGPAAYFTPDWVAAKQSVETLAALKPAIAATGHGTPMSGHELEEGLQNLARRFDNLAVPDHGRYEPEDRTENRRS